MAADPRDLATVQDLQSWLKLGTPSEALAAELQRLVTAVSVWIQSWLSRTIPSQDYLDVANGHGGTRLMLGNYPVTAVASVAIDGVTVPASTGPAVPGWILANDQVMLRGYQFTAGEGNVEVAYTAGYADVPPDLTQACVELAAMRYKERERIGLASVAAGGQQTNYIVRDMPPGVATILQQYRKVTPC